MLCFMLLYYQIEKESNNYKSMKNGFVSSDRHLEFNDLYFFYSLFLSSTSVESEFVQLILQSEKMQRRVRCRALSKLANVVVELTARFCVRVRKQRHAKRSAQRPTPTLVVSTASRISKNSQIQTRKKRRVAWRRKPPFVEIHQPTVFFFALRISFYKQKRQCSQTT